MEPDVPNQPPPSPRPRHASPPIFDKPGPHPHDFVPSDVSCERASLVGRPELSSSAGIRPSRTKRHLSTSQVAQTRNDRDGLADGNTPSSPAKRRMNISTSNQMQQSKSTQSLVTYERCPHKTRITLHQVESQPRSPSKHQQSGDFSPVTQTSSAQLSPLNDERRDSLSTAPTSMTGSPSAAAQPKKLPYVCLECSKIDAIEREMAIRDRYKNEIAKIQHWIEGLRPGLGQNGCILGSLFQAKTLQLSNLRDVKSRRDREINETWRKHEQFHGPRPEDTELDSSSDDRADSLLSDISLDHLEGNSDSMDIDDEMNREETLNEKEKMRSVTGDQGDTSDQATTESVSNTTPLRLCGDPKVENDARKSKLDRQVRSWFGGLEKGVEKGSEAILTAQREWETGGKEGYERNIDEQISQIKERLAKRRFRMSGHECTVLDDQDSDIDDRDTDMKLTNPSGRPRTERSGWRDMLQKFDDEAQRSSSPSLGLSDIAKKACQTANSKNLERQIKGLQLARKEWAAAPQDQRSSKTDAFLDQLTGTNGMIRSSALNPSSTTRPGLSRRLSFTLADRDRIPSAQEESEMAETFARHRGDFRASPGEVSAKGDGEVDEKVE